MGSRAPGRYPGIAIALHWSIALLVIVNLVLGIATDAFKGIPAMPLHKAIGITVLVLSLGLLCWRLTHRRPPVAEMPGWQRGLAAFVHIAFYVLLIAIPLSGWIMVSAGDTRRPLSWFFLFDLPYIAPQGSAIGGPAHSLHELLKWPMVALVLLHIAGALKHQFVDRDSVLSRMLPGQREHSRS
ncbi:cytochrome b [Sphingomonas jatrophae]|uniref:Cytochrome b561 n=1 Tax=Sphingomonas jatrophae TaxID=1166337 RepID=A0A1I6JT45_9SPHN|nr:cytochrome b [Sphingomonas jatrophae]SFR82127.1 cytochrome b561 [Sphingomonas jatrophae]